MNKVKLRPGMVLKVHGPNGDVFKLLERDDDYRIWYIESIYDPKGVHKSRGHIDVPSESERWIMRNIRKGLITICYGYDTPLWKAINQ
jgi:hypothetical protein